MKSIKRSPHHSETPDAYSKMQMECMTSKGKRVAKMARLLLKSI